MGPLQRVVGRLHLVRDLGRSQVSNKHTIQGREDGMRPKSNLGAARSKMIAKIQSILPKLHSRIKDRNRPR